MIKILITDDHAVVRQGLKQILTDEINGVKFGEAGDSAQALELLHKEQWDILVLDINLPGRNGFEVLEEVRRHFPVLPVLVLSSTPEDQLGLRVLKGGASGYLNKRTAAEDLVGAVQKILAGEHFISPALAQKLVNDLRRSTDRPRHETLSEREHHVVKLTVEGKSIKEIAAELSLSTKTISTFRHRAFEKLGVKNDAELARYMRDRGLV